MKINNIFSKLLISILMILTLFNFMYSNYSFAETTTPEASGSSTQPASTTQATSTTSTTGTNINDEAKVVNQLQKENTYSKIIISALKIGVLSPFRAIRSINYQLASSGGVTSAAHQGEITPFDIFFNRFTLLDANIFSTENRDGVPLDQDSIVYKIRVTTAVLYYAIRTIAIILVSVLLTWNLVRSLSKSTSADQKVVAKNAIVDSVVSIALIMFMHIIIILILNFNDLLLQVIEKFTPYSDSGNFFNALEDAVFSSNYILAVTSLVIYGLLEWQTFKYILVYIQRFLVIVLLVIISPIVPITYATDRMRGGKGLALNGWFKELFFNVFVQVLHAIVYAALVGTAMAALTTSVNANTITTVGDLSTAIVAITAMLFIKYAEKMVKTIFGFDNSQIINTNVWANAASTVVSVASSVRNSTNSVAQRVAAGGPLVSFGQNLDGSHIGIGQVAQGLGNSAGRNLNQLRNVRNTFKNGLNGLGVNGEALSSDSSNSDETVETADSSINVTSGSTSVQRQRLDAVIKKSLNSSMPGIEVNSNNNSSENLNINDLDDSSMPSIGNEEIKRSYNNTMPSVDDDLKENQVNIMSSIDEETIKNVMTKIEQNNSNNTNILNSQSSNKNITNSSSTTKVSGTMDPDLIQSLKDELKLHLGNDKKAQDDFRRELKNNFYRLRDDVGSKDKRLDIESHISSLDLSKPEELEKYLNSFEKGSKERDFADAFAKYWNLSNIGEKEDENNDNSLRDLLNYYKAQGLEISDEVYKITESKEVENVIVNNNHSGLDNRPQVSVASNENVEPKINVTPDKQIDKIKDINLKATMKDLAQIDPAKYRVNGKLEGDIQNEIEEQFTSKIEEFTQKMGREPAGIEDIKRNMSVKARKQFDEYKAGTIKPSDLEGDAKDLAILEKEAKHLGYAMSVNDGPVKMASSSSQVIQELSKTKREKIKTTTPKNNNIA